MRPLARLCITGCLVLSSSLHAVAQLNANATEATRNLYANLKRLAPEHLIFGHHNTVVCGIGWTAEKPADWKSDVHRAVGDFPGVYGFDFIDGMSIS